MAKKNQRSTSSTPAPDAVESDSAVAVAEPESTPDYVPAPQDVIEANREFAAQFDPDPPYLPPEPPEPPAPSNLTEDEQRALAEVSYLLLTRDAKGIKCTGFGGSWTGKVIREGIESVAAARERYRDCRDLREDIR